MTVLSVRGVSEVVCILTAICSFMAALCVVCVVYSRVSAVVVLSLLTVGTIAVFPTHTGLTVIGKETGRRIAAGKRSERDHEQFAIRFSVSLVMG